MDNIAALYIPLITNVDSAVSRPTRPGARIESMFLATLLRATHLFDQSGGAATSAPQLFGSILPQVLANDLVTRHEGVFGQLALNATHFPTGGGR